MFKDIFPDKQNRLVYMSPTEKPKGTPYKTDLQVMTPKQKQDAMDRKIADKIAEIPESPKAKKAREWSDAILQSTGTRKRFEKISANESRELVNRTALSIEKYMKGKKKETLPLADGSTLLLERRGAGIMAVVVEGGTKVGGPKQPIEYISTGYVRNARNEAVTMAADFRDTPMGKKQNEVAAMFHKSPAGQQRRMKERAIAAKEA